MKLFKSILAAVAVCSIAVIFALLSLAASSASAATSRKIDHVVLVMMENRPYEQMLGWIDVPGAKGLTGNEYNEYNGVRYNVSKDMPYINPFDPDHTFQGTTIELMGEPYPAHSNPPPMSGFCKHAAELNQSPLSNVLNTFTPDRLNVMSTLAKEFSFMDEYFSSFPGETLVNRMFMNAGMPTLTKDGNMTVDANLDDILHGWDARTIYDMLEEDGLDWKAYAGDVSDLFIIRSMRNISKVFEKFRFLDSFIEDAAAGSLPAVSWVSPRYIPLDFLGMPASDEHPRHQVNVGEEFLSDIYEAVRNSPKWNNTLLWIMYDEVGGFASWMPPMDPIPSPLPGKVATDITPGFDFTRGGMRVPSIIVSPWTKKGHVEHAPATGGYEHTSIYPLLRDLFNLTSPPNGARQAWAASFAHLLDMEPAPRTDCPTSIKPSPVSAEERAEATRREMKMTPSQGLEKELYTLVEGINGRDGSGYERFRTSGELGNHMAEAYQEFLDARTPVMLRGQNHYRNYYDKYWSKKYGKK